ncbi:hypothetical protein R1flu_006269 [Riccia fluitans]|uniref:Uncharacterized protein n=1 Tax=Riccia fluitans TaxID=41844 RepID=A0ABD1YVJ3_9MARC
MSSNENRRILDPEHEAKLMAEHSNHRSSIGEVAGRKTICDVRALKRKLAESWSGKSSRGLIHSRIFERTEFPYRD